MRSLGSYMEKDEKIVLLLDEVSKTKIKTNVSMLTVQRIEIISNLSELAKMQLDSIKVVILLEGFLRAENALTDIRLYNALTSVDFLLLGMDSVLLRSVSEVIPVYQCDISLLSFEMIQAALFSDNSFRQEGQSSALKQDVVLAKEVLKENRDDVKISSLAKSFLLVVSRESQYLQQIAELKEKVRRFENVNGYLKRDNERLLQSYSDLITQAAEFNTNLRQYEITLSKDVYTKLNLSNYVARPHIIYLKEYEELLWIDSLIDTIFSTLRVQNRQSVKVLRLFDSNGGNRIATLPSTYKVLGNSYSNSDIITNDYLCKYGDYVKVLETLLFNKTNLDVLIIVDCKSFNDTVLNGPFLQMNLCREAEHLGKLHLDSANTIVNAIQESNPDLLCWERSEIGDRSKREYFLYLSSRKTIQRVLELSRVFELAV